MRAQNDDKRVVVLRHLSGELRSEEFLAKDDEGRLEHLRLTKERYPDLTDDIERDYLNLLIDRNPAVVTGLRELFSTKQFQITNDLERQLIFDRLMKESSISEGPYRLPRDAVERIAAQQTIKSVGSPFNVMQNAREVFRSKMFSSFPLEDKEKYVELMLQQLSLVQAGINRDDLLKAYWEIEANTAAINRITADPLFLVMARLDPKSVLRTCETTQQFRRLCQNPALFLALMRSHYPDYYETSNPKEQYIAITTGLRTYYQIPIENEFNDDGIVAPIIFGHPIQLGKTQLPHHVPGFRLNLEDPSVTTILLGPGYIPPVLKHLVGLSGADRLKANFQNTLAEIEFTPEEIEQLYRAGKLTEHMVVASMPADYKDIHSDYIVFNIKGHSIPVKTSTWLYIPNQMYNDDNEIILLKRKEVLARYFIAAVYQRFGQAIINDFFQEHPDDDEDRIDWNLDIDEIIKQMNASTPQWKLYLERLGLPHPLNRTSLYQYILVNDELRLDLDAIWASWSFPRITF